MRKVLFAGLLVALAVVAPLSAQNPSDGMASMTGSWVVSLGGGATIPVGDASDIFDTGFHGNATIGYKPANSSLAFMLDAGYHRAENKFLPGLDSTDTVVGTGNSNIFTAFARVNLDLSPNLYFLGGVGILRREFPVEGSNAIFTNTDAGIAATAGVGFVLGRVFFVEGRVINMFGDTNLMIIPITAGVRF